MALSSDHAEPLYRQLAGQLQQAIAAGDLRPGSRLPSEQELIEAYEVSRNTVRLALGVPRTEGLVVTGQGRGTFVADPLPDLWTRAEPQDSGRPDRDDAVLAELQAIREELRQMGARLEELAQHDEPDEAR
jgi:GntR family transcriptional regulator